MRNAQLNRAAMREIRKIIYLAFVDLAIAAINFPSTTSQTLFARLRNEIDSNVPRVFSKRLEVPESKYRVRRRDSVPK